MKLYIPQIKTTPMQPAPIRFILLIIFLLFLILPGINTYAGESEPNEKTTFPRLYFTADKIAQLKDRITNDEQIKSAWENILNRANHLVESDLVSLEYAESGSGQHGNYGRPSGQMSEMGATLGLAYQMTGEEKYAKKIQQALLHYIQLHRWAGNADRDPPWHSELNTARFCFGYGVGFDSIHDYLSEEDRKTIVEGMVRLGILPTLNDWILPHQRIHALDSMGHNWWSVCVAMAGVASLSILEDEPRAQRWVDEIKQAFPEWFAYQGNLLQNKSLNFDRKGAFYESVNYANYALSEYLFFHLAYSNALPESPFPDIPLLEKTGDFFIHTTYPTSDSLLSTNFGDGSIKASGARTLHLLLANGFESPAYHWFLNRDNWGLNNPIGLVYYMLKPQEQPPADLPNSMLYPDIGWCMMRSSWENDATMLALKSGFTWNHAHPDAGSFILFHNGKPLIIDSGNCSYSRREYTTYYRHSKAHNVVLIDGQAQNPEDCGNGDRGVVHPGQVLHLMESAGIKYVLADVTGPTSWKCSRNYRHFLWIDDVILIVDDIRTHQEAQLEWLLHFEGTARQIGNDIHLSNGDDAKAIVRPLFPKKLQVVRKKGLKDHNPDETVDYLALTPNEKSRSMKFITAILPLQPDEKKPLVNVELLEGDEMLGARITHDEKITEVFLNLRADGRRMHRNSNKIIHGWDTDAYIYGLTRAKGAEDKPDSIERGFVICGSYLRKGDHIMLDSLSKVYSVFSWQDDHMNAILQGQPIINCNIWAPKQPSKIRLNEQEVEPEWDETLNTVTFHLSK